MNVMKMQKKITVLVQHYQSNTANLHVMIYDTDKFVINTVQLFPVVKVFM